MADIPFAKPAQLTLPYYCTVHCITVTEQYTGMGIGKAKTACYQEGTKALIAQRKLMLFN